MLRRKQPAHHPADGTLASDCFWNVWKIPQDSSHAAFLAALSAGLERVPEPPSFDFHRIGILAHERVSKLSAFSLHKRAAQLKVIHSGTLQKVNPNWCWDHCHNPPGLRWSLNAQQMLLLCQGVNGMRKDGEAVIWNHHKQSFQAYLQEIWLQKKEERILDEQNCSPVTPACPRVPN
ncbi:hypothetical protein EYF80_015596 [Liparis tanakae]|uniref:Uncharacterized protein n=1 Tax=Liparis tanakae TaxID=230148 RepID=A0A4Z2I8S3_9TELE|nr:hypothetical protein EYF80_015596 [Liparis tanakae]